MRYLRIMRLRSITLCHCRCRRCWICCSRSRLGRRRKPWKSFMRVWRCGRRGWIMRRVSSGLLLSCMISFSAPRFLGWRSGWGLFIRQWRWWILFYRVQMWRCGRSLGRVWRMKRCMCWIRLRERGRLLHVWFRVVWFGRRICRVSMLRSFMRMNWCCWRIILRRWILRRRFMGLLGGSIVRLRGWCWQIRFSWRRDAGICRGGRIGCCLRIVIGQSGRIGRGFRWLWGIHRIRLGRLARMIIIRIWSMRIWIGVFGRVMQRNRLRR